MSKLLRIIAILVVILIAGVIFLLLNINSIVKSGVESGGSYVLKVPVTLEESNISFTGSGELKKLNIANPEGFKSKHLFDLSAVKLSVDLFSVTGDTIHIKEVSVDSAHVIYESAQGTSNVKALLANIQGEPSQEGPGKDDPAPKEETGKGEEPESEPEKEKKIIIDHLLIKGTKVGYSNPLLGGKTINLVLPTIEQKDIGKSEGGAPMSEVVKSIVSEINKSILKSIKEAGQQVGDQVKDLGDKLKSPETKEALDSAKDKLKGLFGK